MESTKILKTIVRNLITLYSKGQFEDQLIYQQALNQGLNRHDLASVKHGFRHQVNNRKIGAIVLWKFQIWHHQTAMSNCIAAATEYLKQRKDISKLYLYYGKSDKPVYDAARHEIWEVTI